MPFSSTIVSLDVVGESAVEGVIMAGQRPTASAEGLDLRHGSQVKVNNLGELDQRPVQRMTVQHQIIETQDITTATVAKRIMQRRCRNGHAGRIFHD